MKKNTNQSKTPFAGKVLLFTGTLTVPRKEAGQKAEEAGAKLAKSLNKTVDYLIIGEKAGSKLEKAQSMGVQVLTEADFWKMLSKKEANKPFVFPEEQGSAADLLAFFEQADWEAFDWDKDAKPLRDMLLRLEKRQGLQTVHRLCTAKLQALSTEQGKFARYKLKHRFGHINELSALGLSPDGQYLATGSWVGDNYNEGGELMFWELETGRCVHSLDKVEGGVGWPNYANSLQWSPNGEYLAMSYDTNGLSYFRPFASSKLQLEAQLYLTDGWSRPAQWTWEAQGKALYMACWSLDYFLPGWVIPKQVEEFPKKQPYNFTKLPEDLLSQEELNSAEELMENKETGQQSPLSVYENPKWSSKGYLFGTDRGGYAYIQNPYKQSIERLHFVGTKSYWSPDGAFCLVKKEAGLELLSAEFTSLGTIQDVAPFDDLIWYKKEEQFCFALLYYGKNGGFALYQQLRLLEQVSCSLEKPGWRLPDARNFVFSDDGSKIALLASPQRVDIYDIPQIKKIAELALAHEAEGILLAREDRLIAASTMQLSFYDWPQAKLLSSYQVGLSDGQPAPPLRNFRLWPWLHAFDSNPSFPIAKDGKTEWITAFESGFLIAPDSCADLLDSELCYSIDNCLAWPYRWAEANRASSIEQALDSPDFPYTEQQRKNMRRYFEREQAQRNRNEYFMTLTRKELFGSAFERDGYHFSDNSKFFSADIRKLFQVEQCEIALRGSTYYKAGRLYKGEELHEELLRSFLGKVLYYVESYNPSQWKLGSLAGVQDKYLNLFHIEFRANGKQGGSSYGGLEFARILFLALAEPL